MYSSDKNLDTNKGRSVLTWLCVTAFIALFGAVYELFSHEVYSYYMIYAFAIPFLLGVFPALLCTRQGRKAAPWAGQLYAGGIMALTVSSILKGVLDIYGTTNRKLIILPIAGMILLLISFIGSTIGRKGLNR